MSSPSPAPIRAPPQASDAADSFYVRGAALWNAGRRQEAIAELDAALRARPDFPEALCMGAFILRQEGKLDAALRFYDRALTLKADFTVAWSNSGKLLFDLDRFAEALAAFDQALALAPEDADGHNNRAGALRELGRLEDSAAAARAALRLRPDFAEAALNLGNALLKLDRVEEALVFYRRARTLKPDFGAAICGEALALRALDRFDEALAAFEEAERLGSRGAAGGKGCLLLTLGDFESGWEGYEARWLNGKALKETLGARYPDWSGAIVEGERVLVMKDHGLGDAIQFFRYVSLMAEAGVATTLLCPRVMHRLFSCRSDVRLIDEIGADDSFDAQVAISSLPRAFATRFDSVPASIPYLEAEPALRDKWAARIGKTGFKIGIVWQGNPNPDADMARAMPLLNFAPLAALANVRLISLQKGFGTEQIAALPPDVKVETLGEDFDAGPDAFVDTAAAMMALDLVVSCDTSVAHLAGALGRPVWVALKKDAEWRWLRDRDDSPWYPTMRLFRQTLHGDWRDVFAAMAAAAGPLAEAPRATRTIAMPGAVGDLIDRITILEIKARRIAEQAKLRNVETELALLAACQMSNGLAHPRLDALKQDLAAVNAWLWDVEDEIRVCEKNEDFGERFIALARDVYKTNDARAALKREINLLFDSAIVEEKSYA
jgi:tetratricopeptide (TPR) repeat protein